MSSRRFRDMRRRFEELCVICEQKNKKNVARRIQSSVTHHRQELERARAVFMYHARALAIIEDKSRIGGEGCAAELGKQHYRRQFGLLFEHPQITDVNISHEQEEDPMLHVFTEEIRCEHPTSRAQHDLGRWMITVNLRSGDLNWEPLDYKPKMSEDNSSRHMVWRAPHVNAQGGACFGDSRAQFDEFFAQGRIANMTALAIRFLECVNPEDMSAVKTLERFPVLEKKEQ